MTAKVWSAYVTYEQPKTEKMTPGLSRMAFWWDPAPNDTSASWFPCGPRYMSRLRKDNCSQLVKKSSSHRPKHDLGLFLFVHETKRCFQKAELGFVHAACTRPFCMRGFGTWSWPAFQSLTKHQVHQRNQGWLLLWECWVVLSIDKSKGLTITQLTPSSAGAVRYRHASGQILTKRKKETWKRSRWFVFLSEHR